MRRLLPNKRAQTDQNLGLAERSAAIILGSVWVVSALLAVAGGPFAITSFLLIGGWVLWQVFHYVRFSEWLIVHLGRPPELAEPWESLAQFQFQRRRRSRERIYSLLRRFRDVQRFVGALPDAAVILNRDQSIVWTSALATKYLGLSAKDRGTPVTSLLRQPQVTTHLRGAHSAPLEIVSPLDEHTLLELRLSELSGDQTILLARDVTQLKQLMTVRQDFVANVSHELRTPLTVIAGYLEQMNDSDIDGETLKMLAERLNGPVLRMRSLVGDLLLLARLESSATLVAEDLPIVNVKALVTQLLRETQSIALPSHRIETQIDAALCLHAVETEVFSCFQNLVTNALRYSPDGGPISVRWYRDGEFALFEVSDQGVGISQDHLHRVTERFFRVDPGRSRESGGTGLGLAIVKHILRRMDSELIVKSELGKGSIFTARIAPQFVCQVPTKT